MKVVKVKPKVTALIVFGLLLTSCFQTVRAEDYVTKHYRWEFRGSTWTWDLPISLSIYNLYRELVPLTERVEHGVTGYASLVTTHDLFMRDRVADELHRISQQRGYGSYDEVSFVLAFVQSLPYVPDSTTTGYSEYPRFPIETLVDGGDCEDKSILFATTIRILGYDALLVYIPDKDHMAVGVLGGEGIHGLYVTYKGGKYFLCETTSKGWDIGEMPPEYRGLESRNKNLPKTMLFLSNQFDKA